MWYVMGSLLAADISRLFRPFYGTATASLQVLEDQSKKWIGYLAPWVH